MSDKPSLVFVDDEERVLRSLKMLFTSHYKVFATVNGEDALDYLERETVHVLVCDQRMPEITGVEVLREAREISPNTLRILLTGYSDLVSILGSVNEGEIYRFINKPWDTTYLVETVETAVDISRLLMETGPQTHIADASAAQVGEPVEILVVDAETEIIDLVRESHGSRHTVHHASDMEEGFALINHHNIGVVVSEAWMQGNDVTNELKVLKAHHPGIVSIALSTIKDCVDLIDLINCGQIFRFLPKPVSRGLLQKNLDAALVHHQAMQLCPQLAKRHEVEPICGDVYLNLSTTSREHLQGIRAKAEKLYAF